MRILIEAAGRRIIDLKVMVMIPARGSPAGPARGTALAGDPHGTVAAQVEQAGEPSPGFGFAGSVATVIARGDGP